MGVAHLAYGATGVGCCRCRGSCIRSWRETSGREFWSAHEAGTDYGHETKMVWIARTTAMARFARKSPWSNLINHLSPATVRIEEGREESFP